MSLFFRLSAQGQHNGFFFPSAYSDDLECHHYSTIVGWQTREALVKAFVQLANAPGSVAQVVFCCFSPEAADHHARAFAELGIA